MTATPISAHANASLVPSRRGSAAFGRFVQAAAIHLVAARHQDADPTPDCASLCLAAPRATSRSATFTQPIH